ncbi:tRNA uridine-5-carboxymethylaminomethyl(34) synthesis GTPase MnmE [Rhodomicrobium vannielii ATCC 17100]|uniref:tRNA uridine-5-carboxymethylaminomethyl(34) synthesis GTPase MnmE n=1 Tax=Rhodomicrobium vannielii TaxID=1069 RepID=UPI0019192E54|nr:tRNA uridine-5-carboxymethylaminomethyl(34) synthesis GTPase MnmE [Rhodomicrobium vannielii]MBJ7535871.1 tRNA uridine-5-carboxymethylaminomethyl(34) synthesis GTPase MnmE [Rhodomicrobium vannielii ATCC 17100]
MTIYALSSAPGRAGIAVIRISGRASRKTLYALCNGRLPAPRVSSFRRLRHPTSREMLDEAMVLWLPGPANFTGEDMAELYVHGGRAVVTAVMNALADVGLRLAEPGEFTRRAFGNGKLDLTEAEGLADLINADTEIQRRQALAQHSGAMRARYEKWRRTLLKAMAYVEASLDFSDEADIADGAFKEAVPEARSLAAELERALADGRRGEILREGISVAIVGEPNVGKSSLLNALAGREAAIVYDEPGTTRDVIEVALDLDGYPFVLRDTAGIREAASPVEQEGVRRALAAAEAADIVLAMVDGSRGDTGGAETEAAGEAGGTPTGEGIAGAAITPSSGVRLLVVNKVDLAPPPAPGSFGPEAIYISAKTCLGLDALKAALVRFASESYGSGEAPTITRVRHRQEIGRARAALVAFLDGAEAGEAPELAAEHLREAADALGRLTGRLDVEDVLGQIFGEFCVGK